MAGGAQESDEPITGINVTPLVDIVLVLLIIFMVTAKLIVSKAVPLDLPKSAAGSDVQVVFSVTLGADGSTVVNDQKLPNDEAISALAKSAHDKNPDIRAVINADAAVPHGRVINVLTILKLASVSKIAFGVVPGASSARPAPVPAPAPAPQ